MRYREIRWRLPKALYDELEKQHQRQEDREAKALKRRGSVSEEEFGVFLLAKGLTACIAEGEAAHRKDALVKLPHEVGRR